ncbi:MAG: hypothetical protein U0T56_01755 [Ferruginibacter sp.]
MPVEQMSGITLRAIILQGLQDKASENGKLIIDDVQTTEVAGRWHLPCAVNSLNTRRSKMA